MRHLLPSSLILLLPLLSVSVLSSCSDDERRSRDDDDEGRDDDDDDAAAEDVAESPTRDRIVNATSLKVRSQPSAESDLVNVLPFGTTIKTTPMTVYDTFDQISAPWHQIEGLPGYVFGGFLAEVDQAIPPKEMVLISGVETQYSLRNDRLVLAHGKVDRTMSEGEEGATGREFQQTGTYTVEADAIRVELESTIGKELMGPDDTTPYTVEPSTIILRYDPEYRGWPTDDIRQLNAKRGWKLDRHERSLIYKVPCVYDRGMCEDRVTYWHTPSN